MSKATNSLPTFVLKDQDHTRDSYDVGKVEEHGTVYFSDGSVHEGTFRYWDQYELECWSELEPVGSVLVTSAFGSTTEHFYERGNLISGTFVIPYPVPPSLNVTRVSGKKSSQYVLRH